MPYLFPDKTVVEIIGNVAAGKTTLAKKLPTTTNLIYQDTDLFENNPFLIPSVKDPKRWAFTEELYFYYLRSKRIPDVLKSLKKSPIVLDQGFHMPLFMYSDNRLRLGHMTNDEWKFIHLLFEKLTQDAPLPDVIIYLKASVEEISRRMDRRGRTGAREHEKLYTNEYIERLQVGLEDYVALLKNKKKTVIEYDFSVNDFKTFGTIDKNFLTILRSLLTR